MALEQDIEVMSVQPILGLLPREGLRLLAFAAETRILRTGDVLFRKGDVADGGYLVITGSIALDPRDDGSPAAEIATPGFLLGETALFADVARPATAVARETTTVMKFARSVMSRVLGEFPEAAAVMHRALCQRMMALSDDLAQVRHQITAAGD
jgi:CRP-like cAMP-binding protein